MRPAEYLEDINSLNHHLHAAHSILLSPNELELYTERDFDLTPPRIQGGGGRSLRGGRIPKFFASGGILAQKNFRLRRIWTSLQNIRGGRSLGYVLIAQY